MFMCICLWECLLLCLCRCMWAFFWDHDTFTIYYCFLEVEQCKLSVAAAIGSSLPATLQSPEIFWDFSRASSLFWPAVSTGILIITIKKIFISLTLTWYDGFPEKTSRKSRICPSAWKSVSLALDVMYVLGCVLTAVRSICSVWQQVEKQNKRSGCFSTGSS